MAILNVKNLPDGLYRKLQARARAQRRSVAAEVTQILEEALAAGPPAKTGRVAEAGPSTGTYSRRLAGRATAGLSTEEIMALTRGTPRK